MPKDQLARGARSATYGYTAAPEDEIVLRNVAPEETPAELSEDVFTPHQPHQPKRPLKKFKPSGHQILVRQAEAQYAEKVYTDQASALKDTSTSLVLIRDEEEKKADAPAEGFVIAVGPGSDDYSMTVKVGDNIVFGKYSGAAFNLNGEWLLLMGVNEVLGTLSNDVTDEEVEETYVDADAVAKFVAEA
jgi:chaperonin GroES